MQGNHLLAVPGSGTRRKPSSSTTLRDVLTVAFRHRRLALTSLFGVLVGAVLAVVVMPQRYQANLKILVRNERSNPVVSPGPEANQSAAPITEEELNSEAELLTSEDVLRKVILKTGMVPPQSALPWSRHTEEERIAMALSALRGRIDAAQMPHSNIIEVKYESNNPQLAAMVLNNLGHFYLEKHLEVHRTSGQYEFFNQEAEHYQKAMQEEEAKLAQFAAAPQLSRDLTIQKLKDFEEAFQQTQAGIAESQRRLGILDREKAATPLRMTTQMHSADNSVLLQSLKSTLLTLQLKREELLTKYQPTYRTVQEVDKEIADTQTAIAAAKDAPMREETTDQDPVHLWERSEIAKATADLVGLQTRATAIQRSIVAYNEQAQALDKKALEQQDLARAVKIAEDNYLLYVHKREEARITDALDERRILNVAITEAAHVPVLPISGIRLRLLMSAGLALIISAGLVILAEYLNPTFRTPAEVYSFLEIPVLASLPSQDADVRSFREIIGRSKLEIAGYVRRLHAGATSNESKSDFGYPSARDE